MKILHLHNSHFTRSSTIFNRPKTDCKNKILISDVFFHKRRLVCCDSAPARHSDLRPSYQEWIRLSITWWSDIALVPKPCNCRWQCQPWYNRLKNVMLYTMCVYSIHCRFWIKMYVYRQGFVVSNVAIFLSKS